ncbi:hypothetical protein [Pseudanabaena mucicola]|uniref:hypothetical protein n=1 Tax=Pseudanabaena mucicola TaxID=71190 RepID=UPI00257898D4|nr:hypothetical protein [Pseudanabaena mucicola]
MNNRQQIITQINKDLGNSSKAEICVEILDYLLRSPKISHITYGSLRKVVSDKYKNEDLLAAIPYITGDSTNLLEVNFELRIDDETIPLPLTVSEVKIADRTKTLYNPETGELVENFEDKVFMYFSPSSLVKKITLTHV